MSQVFGPVYAEAYDQLYREKDYDGECDLIHRLFQRYAQGSIASVVDLGCGTGNHALPLSTRGYEVVGVDRSDSMLAQAERKLARVPSNGQAINGHLRFQQGDIRSVELGRSFDAALMMFAVLSYQLENADVLAALQTARRHLRVGGLLIFDVWYGPAVLHQRPSQRLHVVPTTAGRILRFASGDLDATRHMCTVRFQVWRLAGERVESETIEAHPLRYFFPLELRLLLQCAGFASIRLGGFPDFDKDPDETTWNILVVAEAI